MGATDKTKYLIRRQMSSLCGSRTARSAVQGRMRCIKGTKGDKELVIMPAEKERSTVVLDRTDYLQKAKRLLEDRQSYAPCTTKPVKTRTREINVTLLALENSDVISPIYRRKVRAKDTALARFYGLLKVHKEGVPLRPIVSFKGAPTHGLAKWLFQRLKFLTANSDATANM
ncbi:hypothetical protein SprV_0401644400 [Sparganum proliferum]